MAAASPKTADCGLHYASVLPEQGVYALFEGNTKRHVWCDSLAELSRQTAARHDQADLYFATASFKDGSERTIANALYRRAFCFDIDAGPAKVAKHGAKVYATQREALAALLHWCQGTDLVPAWIISSGAGLHVYFLLDTDTPIAEWLPVAIALKAKAQAAGLKIDPGPAANAALVLRPVGSLHNNGNRVEVIKHIPRAVYGLGSIAAKAVALMPAGPPTFSAMSGSPTPARRVAALRPMNAEILGGDFSDRPPASFAKIVAGCAAVALAAKDNGAGVAEPMWRAALGIVKFCADPDKTAHQVSKGHADYDPVETQAKLDGYAAGPTTCAHFGDHAPEACAGCEHRGKIKSPIVLGYEVAAVASAPTDGGGPFSGCDDGVPPSAVAVAPINAAAQVVAAVRAKGIAPIRGTDGRYWAAITAGGARHAVQLDSNEARDHVRLAIRRATGKCTDATLESALSELRAQALESTERHPVHLRVAKVGGHYFVSMGDGLTTMRVGPGTVDATPAADGPLFALGTGAGRLPAPVVPATAQEAYALHDAFHKARGVPDAARLPLIVATVECLRPDTPYPVISLVGTAGSGKSTKALEIKQTIDPSDSPVLSDVRFDERDMAAVAQHQHVLVVDNASHLSPDKQDFACKVSTGVIVMCREMHTNGGVEALSVHRPLILTSIGVVTTRPDLADRTVLVELPAREGFQSLEELQADFKAQQPALFGALLRLLASAMEQVPSVRQRMPRSAVRLADFALLGEAVCEAAGLGESFTEHLLRLRKAAAVVAADSDAFVVALQRVIFGRWASEATQSEVHPPERQWQRIGKGYSVIRTEAGALSVRCTYAALMEAVGHVRSGIPYELAKMLPTNPKAAGTALNRVHPVLRDLGWHTTTATGRVSVLAIDIGPEAHAPDH